MVKIGGSKKRKLSHKILTERKYGEFINSAEIGGKL